MKRGEYSPTDIPASKIPLVIYWIPAVATAHLTCSNCFSFFFSQKPWSEPCVQTPTDRRGKKTFQKDENIPGQDLTASKFYRYLELDLYAAILKVCVRLCVCTCVCGGGGYSLVLEADSYFIFYCLFGIYWHRKDL